MRDEVMRSWRTHWRCSVGRCVQTLPELSQRIAAAPPSLASPTLFHRHLTLLTRTRHSTSAL